MRSVEAIITISKTVTKYYPITVGMAIKIMNIASANVIDNHTFYFWAARVLALQALILLHLCMYIYYVHPLCTRYIPTPSPSSSSTASPLTTSTGSTTAARRSYTLSPQYTATGPCTPSHHTAHTSTERPSSSLDP